MIEATITLVDSGLFTELAVRLARDFARVRSAVPWFAEFPTINDRSVGRWLGVVDWIEDPYRDEIFDTTDLYCFPDIFRAGDQDLLARLGKPVWGSRSGDEMETDRIGFRKLQEQLGMPVPEYAILEGYSALAAYLEDHGHCFVKTTSKIRGSMETHEFWDIEQDAYWLEDLAVKLGGARERVRFMVEEPVESEWESGVDTYCVRGQCPKTPLQGIEVKGKLMLSSAQIRGQTPNFMDEALAVLAPTLRRHGYCNFLSGEFRKNVLTDFCARCPNPGIGVEMEMIRNLGDIIWRGAHGDLVEPEFEYEYGVQVAIYHDHDKDLWKQFRLPDQVRRWVKLMEFCQIDGLYQIIPRPPHGDKIGWLVGVGHSLEEMAAHLHANAEQLEDYPFDIKLDCLEDAIAQAIQMEKEGLEFSDQPIPEPATLTDEP